MAAIEILSWVSLYSGGTTEQLPLWRCLAKYNNYWLLAYYVVVGNALWYFLGVSALLVLFHAITKSLRGLSYETKCWDLPLVLSF